MFCYSQESIISSCSSLVHLQVNITDHKYKKKKEKKEKKHIKPKASKKKACFLFRKMFLLLFYHQFIGFTMFFPRVIWRFQDCKIFLKNSFLLENDSSEDF